MVGAASTPVLIQRDSRRSEVALELIEDHFPLVLVRWVGPVQPQHVLGMIRFIDSQVENAAAEKVRLVQICDAREAALPSSLVRDMLIDWLSDRPRNSGTLAMRSFVVVSDPMIRGVVASLRWATGRGDRIQVVGTLEQAIEGARQAFEESGQPVPQILLASEAG
jgi:hypothetical protein